MQSSGQARLSSWDLQRCLDWCPNCGPQTPETHLQVISPSELLETVRQGKDLPGEFVGWSGGRAQGALVCSNSGRWKPVGRRAPMRKHDGVCCPRLPWKSANKAVKGCTVSRGVGSQELSGFLWASFLETDPTHECMGCGSLFKAHWRWTGAKRRGQRLPQEGKGQYALWVMVQRCLVAAHVL